LNIKIVNLMRINYYYVVITSLNTELKLYSKAHGQIVRKTQIVYKNCKWRYQYWH
jgi:hypothetical protein